MLIINKPWLPPIHLNRPTAAFEADSAAPRLVLRLQWACFGGLIGRLGLLMIERASIKAHYYKNSPCAMQHIMWSAEGCWLAAAAPGPLQSPQTGGGNYAGTRHSL